MKLKLRFIRDSSRMKFLDGSCDSCNKSSGNRIGNPAGKSHNHNHPSNSSSNYSSNSSRSIFNGRFSLALLFLAAIILPMLANGDMAKSLPLEFLSSSKAQEIQESSIDVLNPQSYPFVGGNWTVFFKTQGKHDLLIRPTGGTSKEDIKFVELGCEGKKAEFDVVEEGMIAREYSCDGISYSVVRVLTSGKHHQELIFGKSLAYANNSARIRQSGYFTQHGTAYVPINVGRKEVTIAPVSNISRAFVLAHQWMWQRDVTGSTTAGAGNADYMMVAASLLNETTILLERSGLTDDIFVTWMVVEALNEEFFAQQGKKDFSALGTTTTTDVLSPAVNPANTLVWQTMNTTLTADHAGNMMFTSYLVGGGTITFLRGGTGAITGFFRWLAVEWDSSKVASISKGTADLTGIETYAAPLKVNIAVQKNQSFLFYQCAGTENDDGVDQAATAGYIRNDTELDFYTYDDDTGTSNDWTRRCYWMIIDFGSKAGKREQQDNVLIASTTYLQTDNFISAIQENRSLAYLYTTANGDTNLFPRDSFFYNMTSSSITYEKRYGGTAEHVAWEILELPFNNMPNVSLIHPQNNQIIAQSPADFNFTVIDIDGTIQNCSLFFNISGSFIQNDSLMSPSESTNLNLGESLPSGDYSWNIQCFDDYGDSLFDDANFTLHLDINPPAIMSASLNVSSINQTHAVLLNLSVIDRYNVSYVNATIVYPNGTAYELSMTNKTLTQYLLVFSDTNLTGLFNVTNIVAQDQLGNTNSTAYTDLVFTVTASPPGIFDLLSPLNNTESQETMPAMSWQQSSDEHFSNYTLQIDNDPSFSDIDFEYAIVGVENTSKTISQLNQNSTYYWRVIARDIFGSERNSTSYFRYVTDNIPPQVSLSQPDNLITSSSSNILFNYSVSELNTLSACSLYLNTSGSFIENSTNTSPQKEVSNYFSASFGEGYYLWNIRCNDSASNNLFAPANWSFTIDLSQPNVSLLSPNDTFIENTTNNVVFEVNTTDRFSGISHCDLLIDGSSERTKIGIQSGVVFNFTHFLLNGNYSWAVNCTDTAGFTAGSEMRNITVTVVDADPPLATLNYPLRDEFFIIDNITFNYTAEDATGIENCSLHLDGALNQTDYAVENFQYNHFNISSLPEGMHYWQIVCVDNSTEHNSGSSQPRNFTIDLTNPSIALDAPGNNSLYGYADAYFNYTPIDSNLDSCVLYSNFSGNFLPVSINSSPVSNQPNLFYESTDDGQYAWNVWCNDSSGRHDFASENLTIRVDTTAPYYSANKSTPQSQSAYNSTRQYHFNITWQDMFGVDSVLFENNFSGELENYTLTPAGSTYNFTLAAFKAGEYSYRWSANDSSDHINETQTYPYVIEKAASIINLTFNGTQGNYTVNESSYINLTARLSLPESEYIEVSMDDSLIMNGSSPISNVSYFTNPGVYNLSVSFNGSENYTQSQLDYLIIIKDTSLPNVSLLTPPSEQFISTAQATFQYNVSDKSSIKNCSLYINGTLNITDTEIIRDTPQTFQQSFLDGKYRWQVKCYDSENNLGQSGIRNFTVSLSTRMNLSVSSDKLKYVQNYTANITANSTGLFGNPVESNMTIDIILGNTTISWWNTSWQHRLSALISSPYDFNHTETIYFNATNLSGRISSCVNELRMIDSKDNLNQEVPIQIMSGDDSNHCYLRFNAQVTASLANDSRYQLYFGNPSATDPAYSFETAEPRVQRSTIYSTSSTIVDSITQVNISRAFSYFTYNANANHPSGGMISSTLNPANIVFDKYTTAIATTVAWQVLEYPDLSVQRGTLNMGASDNNATIQIDPVDLSNSFIIINPRAESATNGRHYYGWSTARFLDSGNIYVQRDSITVAAVIDWQVISWKGARVQQGNVTLAAATTASYDISPVNTSRSFAVLSYRTNTAATNANTQYAFVNLTNSTQVTVSRTTGTGNMAANFFVVELPVGASVEKIGSAVLTNTNQFISSATMNKTLNFHSWRNDQASTTFTRAYMIGNLTNTNNLTFTKQVSGTGTNTVITYIVQIPTLNMSTSIIGNFEKLIAQNRSQSSITGTHIFSWNTTNNTNANYSIVVASESAGFDTGHAYSRFEIISDQTPPGITLQSPADEYNTSQTAINFTWTPTDEFYKRINCTLDLNGTKYFGIMTDSGNLTRFNASVSDSLEGYLSWNVSCTDEKNNTNTSGTWRFFILGSTRITNITLADDNQSIELKWTQAVGATSYSIHISTNYSSGFSETPNITGITTLNWTDAQTSSSIQKYYRISPARGNASRLGQDVAGKIYRELNGSWEMISFPFNITNNLLGDKAINRKPIAVFPADAVMAVYRLNASSQMWESVSYQDGSWQQSIGSDTFTGIEPARGYWFEMAKNGSMFYLGIVINDTFNVSLKSGWNLIGSLSTLPIPLKGLDEEPPSTPFNLTPANTMISLYHYTSLDNDWNYTEHYDSPAGWFSVAARPLGTFDVGKGYYAEMNDNATWQVGR